MGGNPLGFSDSLGLAIECKTIFKLPFFDVEECADNGKIPSEQDAKDAKRMSDRELDKACKNNGYKDPHDFKRDYGLGSDKDIFVDRHGNMYAGPRKGTGIPQYLNMDSKGITLKP